MRHPEFNSYSFERTEHWWAGCSENFDLTQAGMDVIPVPEFEPIRGTGKDDVTTALATDVCDRLFWLRPATGELVLLQSFGPQVQGNLLDAGGAASLVVGATRLWVLNQGRVLRYALKGLQYLGSIEPLGGDMASAIAGDGSDGLWWLQYGAGDAASVQRFDRYGQAVGDAVSLGRDINEASLAVTPDGRHVVILVRTETDSAVQEGSCEIPERWSLIIVDTCHLREDGVSHYDALCELDENFHPRLVAADRQSRIHLADPATGEIWTLSTRGELLDQITDVFPDNALPLAAISARERLASATAAGIGFLNFTAEAMGQGTERRAVFITPTLVSPEGRERGWQRVDVDARLPEGTSLEISCIATGDVNLIAEIDGILGDATLSAAIKAKQIQDKLKWTTEGVATSRQGGITRLPAGTTRLPSVVYAGAVPPHEERRFRYLLHEVNETHLWLRLVLTVPPGCEPPQIQSVRVYYPNLSYLRYLPAVYQEDPSSAAQLRRFLAPFESLFGDLDLVIDQLAAHIDPKTAPAEWLPLLLRWLGFPTMEGLEPTVQRRLLQAAPELLANRGTLGALKQLLDIVTGIPWAVEDPAGGPAPWVLQHPDSGLPLPRLGCDTLIRAKRPYAFRLRHMARLGATPLGDAPVDSVATFAQQADELHLRLCADAGKQEQVEAIVRRFLPYFIPAHCRYRIEFVPPAYWTESRRLGDNLVLADPHSACLGSQAVLGRLRLPLASDGDGIIGRSVVTDGSRLN
jgi:phage tail-like protein